MKSYLSMFSYLYFLGNVEKPPLECWLARAFFRRDVSTCCKARQRRWSFLISLFGHRTGPRAGHPTSRGGHLSGLSLGHVPGKTIKCLLCTSALFLLCLHATSWCPPSLRQPRSAPPVLSLSPQIVPTPSNLPPGSLLLLNQVGIGVRHPMLLRAS